MRLTGMQLAEVVCISETSSGIFLVLWQKVTPMSEQIVTFIFLAIFSQRKFVIKKQQFFAQVNG